VHILWGHGQWALMNARMHGKVGIKRKYKRNCKRQKTMRDNIKNGKKI
jgi:hypothetical protein